MEGKKWIKVLFLLSETAYFISAASIWLIPISDSTVESTGAVSYIPGILFWIGLVLGVLFWALAYGKCRLLEGYKRIRGKSRPGFITFFSNKPAIAADVLFILSLILTGVSAFVRMNFILSLCSLFVLLFTFHLHYLLNGRVYKYIKARRVKTSTGVSEVMPKAQKEKGKK